MALAKRRKTQERDAALRALISRMMMMRFGHAGGNGSDERDKGRLSKTLQDIPSANQTLSGSVLFLL